MSGVQRSAARAGSPVLVVGSVQKEVVVGGWLVSLQPVGCLGEFNGRSDCGYVGFPVYWVRRGFSAYEEGEASSPGFGVVV